MARRDTARWLTTLALCAAVLATFRVADAAFVRGLSRRGLHHPRPRDRQGHRLYAGGRGNPFVDNGGDGRFKDAFLSSISMILVSELGDEAIIAA